MRGLRSWAIGCAVFALGAVFAVGNVAAQAPANGDAPAAAPSAGAVAAPSAGAEAATDDALTARLKHLETDLRCLVCQNQTLADSDAPLAADLRREVRELAVAGKSDDDIRAYLTARYGDFVLYNPPVKRTTWVLWFGPFLLLAVGAIAWAGILRRRATPAPDAPGEDQAAEARGRDHLK